MTLVAVTRAPSPLSEGWLSVPVTRREIDAAAVRSFFASAGDAGSPESAGTWVALTSAFTCRALVDHLPIPAACVGPATARAAAEAGWNVRLVAPRPHGAKQLAEALVAQRPASILFPCAAGASQVIEDAGIANGIPVYRFPVYSTVEDRQGVEELREARPDVVVVTAPSAARAISAHWPAPPPLVAIGQSTAAELTKLGLPAIVAESPTREDIGRCVERIIHD